jgi:hypothetical protein
VLVVQRRVAAASSLSDCDMFQFHAGTTSWAAQLVGSTGVLLSGACVGWNEVGAFVHTESSPGARNTEMSVWVTSITLFVNRLVLLAAEVKPQNREI